jgi:hypothetical protein
MERRAKDGHILASDYPSAQSDRLGLLEAIRQVESGGNDLAVGDGGKSVGPYQCGLAAFLDGGGRRQDYPRLAYDRAATEKIMMAYWQRYGAVTDEQRARLWNGGPRGMSKAATLPYWRKVESKLTKERTGNGNTERS